VKLHKPPCKNCYVYVSNRFFTISANWQLRTLANSIARIGLQYDFIDFNVTVENIGKSSNIEGLATHNLGVGETGVYRDTGSKGTVGGENSRN
jgi:hypothetical protein